jgi:hypothetical protein
MVELRRVTMADLATLRDISIETFSDTFGSENTAADMATYLETAYPADKLSDELGNAESFFTSSWWTRRLPDISS